MISFSTPNTDSSKDISRSTDMSDPLFDLAPLVPPPPKKSPNISPKSNSKELFPPAKPPENPEKSNPSKPLNPPAPSPLNCGPDEPNLSY